MNSEDILKKLVHTINKNEAKDLDSHEDRIKYWMKKFSSKEALSWDDKVLDLESQYLKSCLTKKPLYNCYEIKNVGFDGTKYGNKIIIWNEDVTSMVVDAIVVPASYDISKEGNKKLHNIYYSNGVKLRKKIINIMNGEKLNKNEVLITRAYGILADYIMHVNYDDIKLSIINVMECSRVNMVKTIAICVNNNLEDTKTIYDTVVEYLDKYNDFFDRVILAIEDAEVRKEIITWLDEKDEQY